MRKVFLFLFVFISLDAVSFEPLSPTIVNGHEADISTYPFMATLYYDRREDFGYYGYYCGATILDDKHVLTAAHCVQNSNYNKYTTVALQLEDEGDFDNIQKIPAKTFYYRDDYKHGAQYFWENDIAIIELEYPMKGVPSSEFVLLPKNGDEENYRVNDEKFKALGHGNTQSNVDDSEHLLQVALYYVEQSACELFASVKSGHICTYGKYNETTKLNGAICQGDSGGPLLWFDGSQYRQIGISSFGPSVCGNPLVSVHGVFTEVLDYLPWINSVISGNEIPKYSTDDSVSVGSQLSTEVIFETKLENTQAASVSLFGIIVLLIASYLKQLMVRRNRTGHERPHLAQHH